MNLGPIRSRHRPRFSRWRFTITLVLCTIVVLTTITGWWIERQLSGPLTEWARLRATNIATTAINGAVRDILSGRLQELDLVQYVGGENSSRAPLIQYNMGPLNQVMSDAVQAILEVFKAQAPQDFYVPLGELSGMQIFAGWGPPVPIRILTTGSVVAAPKVDFTAAGINQVVHRLYIDVEVRMVVLAPFVNGDIVVRQPVIVTEEILPGDVPDTYVNLVGYSGGLEEWTALLESLGRRSSDGQDDAGANMSPNSSNEGREAR